MNEFQKAIALADKYAKAGIQLTEAERNLLRYLANKKQFGRVATGNVRPLC